MSTSSTTHHSFMSKLSGCEREYVSRMQRPDKDALMHLVCNSDRSCNRKREREYERSESPPLRIRVLQSRLPQNIRLRIFTELGRSDSSSSSSEKYTTWVRRLLQLPIGVYHRGWCTFDRRNDDDDDDDDVTNTQPRSRGRPGDALTKSRLSSTTVEAALANAKKMMDKHVTGHTEAKVEILKLVCQSLLQGSERGGASQYSLGFEGPPGVGKTHFVRVALAAALNRPLVTIPLGGATDVSYLLGHLYVYEGSKEGRLAAGLIEARCCNPIVYFDELDKVSTSERGTELISALIHLVDPTANMDLRDRYFHDIDIDFSKCTFVFSYNDASRVSPILLDRIKRIRMPAPTEAERRMIICDHLVPRVQKRLDTNLCMSAPVIDLIISRSIVQSKRHGIGGGGRYDGHETSDGRACVSSSANVGMRSAEKDVDHVIASAQLCVSCGYDDGTIVGVPRAKIMDAGGCISIEFAERVLALSSVPTNDVPPTSMYL